jgi:hypothetical protein
MIVALGALLMPGPVRSQSGPDCTVAGAPGPIRSGPSSATPPSDGRASVRCSYGGRGQSAAVSIDYRCEGNRSRFQRQAAREHDERGNDRGPFVADRRDGGFRSYGTPFSNQDRVFYLIDDQTYATVIAHSNGGQDLAALRALARRVAARNDPASALGCNGNTPVETTDHAEPDSTAPEPAVVRPRLSPEERVEPEPETTEVAPSGTCDRYHPEDRGLLTLFEEQAGGWLGRVGVSRAFEVEVPGTPCFGEKIGLTFAANAHGLDGDHCSVGASVSGSLSVCTEAFCLEDCVTGTVSGGWSTESERRCDDPPYWSCDEARWCERRSGTISLERSQTLKPEVSIGVTKARMACGLELGISVGVSGNVTQFSGPSCDCDGGWAGTIRGFTTVSGTANCGLELLGRHIGLPSTGVEGCINVGARRDAGACSDAGIQLVGGASFKWQVPPISIGWFKVNGTVQSISAPEGVETGCTGPTDL